MSPLNHHATVVATLHTHAQTLSLEQNLAFMRAETLARVLDRAGMHAVCEVQKCADSYALILHVQATPPAVTEAVEDAGLAYRTLEFLCDFTSARSWIEVDVFGSPIIVFSEIAMVQATDRAALLDKVAA